ncbi:MAG: cupin domain-containing protein, partial [Pseudomonadota bacterium]
SQAPETRGEVETYERILGAFLRDECAEEMEEGSLDALFARIDGNGHDPKPEPIRFADSPLPEPVMEALGVPFGEIPWRFRLPGVSDCEITTSENERVTLLRARPGAKVPQHTHTGREITLVLSGALADDGKMLRKGDVSVSDHEDDHMPEAVGDETCYCLIVMEGEVQFTRGLFRVLNLFGQ